METLDLVYDWDSALAFAVGQTGLSEDTCREILCAQDLYEGALGILPRDLFDDDVDLDSYRRTWPELFPDFGIPYVATELEYEFCVRATGKDSKVVAAVIEAQTDYMRRVGIVADL